MDKNYIILVMIMVLVTFILQVHPHILYFFGMAQIHETEVIVDNVSKFVIVTSKGTFYSSLYLANCLISGEKYTFRYYLSGDDKHVIEATAMELFDGDEEDD